ncbi:MAG: HU family DNA-binding protein [Planctomycetota bacterium]|nr:HU family DNA-binding protein [Planctomycetota bacterium]
MNRNEMIEGIMRQAGISKANVDRFYEGLVALAGRELLKNNRFVLPGLGVLRVRRRAARMARNPQTGEPVHVPARKVVRFKTYSALDELMNGPRRKSAQAPPPEPTGQLPMDEEPQPEQAS